MSGLLLQVGATKLAVSIVLAGAVWMVHRTVDRPAVSYPLWLLVLVTLLVPAVVSLPVLPGEPIVAATAPAVSAPGVVFAEVGVDSATGPRLGEFLQPGLAILWLGGTAGLLGWTAVQTIRFRRRLKRAVRPAPARLRRHAAAVGRALGLSRIPEMCTTNARVTPMVWWSGTRVWMLVPSFLLNDSDREELRAILAHELAHVRRRDHLVRWLEWLACSAFWWNPVVWWARYQLRIAEESCCDQLAVTEGKSCPRTYAKALLRVVANASEPSGFRPPLPASAAGGIGHAKALERRIRMIVSTDTRPPAPRWLHAASRLAVVCMLPLGLIYCDHYRPIPARPLPAEEETTLDPVEGAALDSPDELIAAADETTGVLPRPDAEFQKLTHYQELIRQAVESGRLSEPRGREASGYLTNAMHAMQMLATADEATGVLFRPDAEFQKLVHYQELIWQAVESGRLRRPSGREASGYLTNAMQRELTALFLARGADRNRGLWPGDHHVSSEDLRSPELSGALAEMLELVEEIRKAPDRTARSEEQSRRIQLLNRRIYAAIGLIIEPEM
ncbi:MAG: M56 family metallopeptidase [Rhodospirillales bacterium]|nr:M56 family metallopeptidase [Rhodospirillales bacterium]